MPLSNRTVAFPASLPPVPFIVKCKRGAERSGLIRGNYYEVNFVVKDAISHRGDGAKGYIVSPEGGELLPNIWNPDRFEMI